MPPLSGGMKGDMFGLKPLKLLSAHVSLLLYLSARFDVVALQSYWGKKKKTHRVVTFHDP